ncbi:MAG: DUF4340 domain-containing protein [Lachnospiraceae bacterium]
MKKQKMQMLVLLVLLVVFVGGYFGLKAYNSYAADREAAQEEENKLYALNIDKETIQSMTWEYQGVTYTFEKVGEDWTYPEDESLTVNTTTLNAMAGRAAQIEAGEKIEGVTDLEQYGLAEPSVTAQVVTADHTYTICIGNYNSTISQYYLYVDDASTVYTVGATAGGNFNMDLEDVIVEEEETTEVSE